MISYSKLILQILHKIIIFFSLFKYHEMSNDSEHLIDRFESISTQLLKKTSLIYRSRIKDDELEKSSLRERKKREYQIKLILFPIYSKNISANFEGVNPVAFCFLSLDFHSRTNRVSSRANSPPT